LAFYDSSLGLLHQVSHFIYPIYTVKMCICVSVNTIKGQILHTYCGSEFGFAMYL